MSNNTSILQNLFTKTVQARCSRRTDILIPYQNIVTNLKVLQYLGYIFDKSLKI